MVQTLYSQFIYTLDVLKNPIKIIICVTCRSKFINYCCWWSIFWLKCHLMLFFGFRKPNWHFNAKRNHQLMVCQAYSKSARSVHYVCLNPLSEIVCIKIFALFIFCTCFSNHLHEDFSILVILLYRKISNIRRTKSPNLHVSRLVLQLPLSNAMKPGVKSRMKM